MKTKLLNSKTKLSFDNELVAWLQNKDTEINKTFYKAVIIGTDGNAYRTVTVGSLDEITQLSVTLYEYGLIDLLSEHGPLQGLHAIYHITTNA